MAGREVQPTHQEGIVGHGDIASVIEPKEGFLYFASGVSNSKEVRESEYEREIDLLMDQDKSKHLVYFSSLCVFYADTRYALHKREMEYLIKENFKHYTIVRLGNITWGKNPNTIINYFKDKKVKGEEVKLEEGYRYLVDKKEFLHWLDVLPEWNCEFNITGKMTNIKDIYANA